MKVVIIICALVSFLSSFSFGYRVCKDQYEDAYKAFSNPNQFCLLWTDDNGMRGFQYKNKTYPLMTKDKSYKLAKSMIWSNKFIDTLYQFATDVSCLSDQHYKEEINRLKEFHKDYKRGRIFKESPNLR